MEGRPVGHNQLARMNRNLIGEEKRNWQGLAYFGAKEQCIPPCEAISLETWVVYKDRRGWLDIDGPAPTVKWCIDGLVQAGVIEDDRYPFIVSLTYLPALTGDWVTNPLLMLKITAQPRPVGPVYS